jgi:hypothetical protein
MIWWLGWACVAWTFAELMRMGLTGSAARTAPMRPRTATQSRAGTRRFAAWDERGRPIVVEDLGRAR